MATEQNIRIQREPFAAVSWYDNAVRILDQKKLPHQEVYYDYTDWRDVARSIKEMEVRGAPAIGITAAYGIALWARGASADHFEASLAEVAEVFRRTRPTAVNLFWAIERSLQTAKEALAIGGVSLAKDRLLQDALQIHIEDEAACRTIGQLGLPFIKDGARVLTHCNAGALATGGYGTALAPVRAAHEAGRKVRVFADETRPYLQGARLTCWELAKSGIEVELLTDNMAGYFFSRGEIDLVIVGADRIAANGDTANKIGTYTVAVLAKEHGVPFYVAAPISTIDRNISSGKQIPIEERSSDEVTTIGATRISPEGVKARHPAFDVTPAKYIRAILTERGVAEPSFESSIAALF
jgi:methylthioribose-1-phosphate isomerase